MESWSQEYVTQARERVIKPAPTSKNVVTIFLMDLQMVPNPKFPSKFPHQHERLFHTRLVCSKDIFYFPIQQKDTPCTNTEQFRIGAAALHGIGPRWYGTMTKCSKNSFKKQLDQFLQDVPDQPLLPAYLPYRMADSNSLVEMVKHRTPRVE